MTPKAAIYDAMRDTNGALAFARWHVQQNELESALVQCNAAQITLALAKVRIEARMAEESDVRV